MASRAPAATKAAAPIPMPAMPWLTNQLMSLMQQQSHAFLLEGASGLGQFDLALAWSKAMLCEGRSPESPAAPACGACDSCHAVAVHTHPDLLVLLPEVLQLEWGWTAAEAEAGGDSKRKPSREIRVEAMRQMITFSQRTNARGRAKVVLIYPAENMNAVTANALLKTLEEPPGTTRFILVTEAAHRLLPTIRSRCHAWKMQWPDEAASLAWLQAQGRSPEQTQAALRLAGGRPQDAWARLEAGFDSEGWQRLPADLRAGHAGVLAQSSASEFLAVLQQLCHDLMAKLAGAGPRYFSEQALAPLVNAASTQTSDDAWRQQVLERLGQWSVDLIQAVRTSEHPYSPELMQAALVDQARTALNWRFVAK